MKAVLMRGEEGKMHHPMLGKLSPTEKIPYECVV